MLPPESLSYEKVSKPWMSLSIDFSTFCLNKITGFVSRTNTLQQITWIAIAYIPLSIIYLCTSLWTDFNIQLLKSTQFLERKHKSNYNGGTWARKCVYFLILSPFTLLHKHRTSKTQRILPDITEYITLATYSSFFAQRLPNAWQK